MRIAMLGWEFPPFKAGGLGVHCYELTYELSKLGVEIDFYMPAVGMEIKPHANNLRIHQVRASPSLGPYQYLPKDFFYAVKEYNKNLVEEVLSSPDFDVVHAHDWLTLIAAVEIKKRSGKPLVVTVHSTEWDRTGGRPYDWIFEIEKEGFKSADVLISVSRRMKRILVDIYGIDANKIWVVYNGVNIKKVQTKIERGLWGKKIVLYLGRLTIQKNPEAFILAAKRVLEMRKDVHFIICGTGDMLGYLIDKVIELGIAENVTFTGYASDEEVSWLYSIANVYVLPAISEPFGISVLEAMGAGVPVIISKEVGVGEVLRHCLKVDFWDVDGIAEKILTLLEFTPLVEELVPRAIEEAKTFTWHKTAKETLEIYRIALMPAEIRPKPPPLEESVPPSTEERDVDIEISRIRELQMKTIEKKRKKIEDKEENIVKKELQPDVRVSESDAERVQKEENKEDLEKKMELENVPEDSQQTSDKEEKPSDEEVK